MPDLQALERSGGRRWFRHGDAEATTGAPTAPAMSVQTATYRCFEWLLAVPSTDEIGKRPKPPKRCHVPPRTATYRARGQWQIDFSGFDLKVEPMLTTIKYNIQHLIYHPKSEKISQNLPQSRIRSEHKKVKNGSI